MTFKDPETNDYFPAWVEYFNKMNVPIPEQQTRTQSGSILIKQKFMKKYSH
jgi:hypothetical protein